MSDNLVYIFGNQTYDSSQIAEALKGLLNIPKDSRVVIKPNFVQESHKSKISQWDYIITHPSVIEAVLDIALEQLDGTGEIAIVDSPMAGADYELIIKRTCLKKIVDKRRKETDTKIDYFDLRLERWKVRGSVVIDREKLPGDPKGYVRVELGDASEFKNKQNKDYYGADYDIKELRKYHNEENNIYMVSRTVLESDVFINLPKLKTHRLAGITCCLKNIAGTVGFKNSLPHHTLGTPVTHGDEYEKSIIKNIFESSTLSIGRSFAKYNNPFINNTIILIVWLHKKIYGKSNHVIRFGSWYGNDTIWRTIIDLNKILYYSDYQGILHRDPLRKYYAVVDAIYAGEGNGPLDVDRKDCNMLIFGTNPVAVDATCASLMGFEYRKIPSIINSFNVEENKYKFVDFSDDKIELRSNLELLDGKRINKITIEATFKFTPHFGWIGHIER